MAKATRTVPCDEEATLDDRLPEILDEVLGQLSQVGVDRILQLAGEMVRARMAEPPTAHLAPRSGEQN